MTDWETLLLVCTGVFGVLMQVHWFLDKMGNTASEILALRRDVRSLSRDAAVLRIQLDAMAAREAERLKKEGNLS